MLARKSLIYFSIGSISSDGRSPPCCRSGVGTLPLRRAAPPSYGPESARADDPHIGVHLGGVHPPTGPSKITSRLHAGRESRARRTPAQRRDHGAEPAIGRPHGRLA